MWESLFSIQWINLFSRTRVKFHKFHFTSCWWVCKLQDEWLTRDPCTQWQPRLQCLIWIVTVCSGITVFILWVYESMNGIELFLILESLSLVTGVILELSEREKFCDNFRISGRSIGPDFGFPHTLCIFSLLPQLKIGRSASLGRLFLPNRPPGWPLGCF